MSELYDDVAYKNAIETPLEEKIKKTIEFLTFYAPVAERQCNGPIPLLFSGGKDSIVIKHLSNRAGIKTRAIYNMTTIDPPELIKFIRHHHPDVIWDKPERGPFFKRLKEKGPPTRMIRWCCSEYKEKKIESLWKIAGIRAEESKKRKNNWAQLTRFSDMSIMLNPILYWTDNDVWRYIKENNMPYCSLYDEGFTRLGCIGCPLSGLKNQVREFQRWPKYAKMWHDGIVFYWEFHHGKMSTRGPRKGTPYYSDVIASSGHEFWLWWLLTPAGTEETKTCAMGLF